MENEIKGNGGAVFDSISKNDIANIKIPLPPLEVQEEIVKELDQYQAIIDGAQKVVDNWKPTFTINPNWEKVKLGDVCETVSGGTPSKANAKFWENGTIKWISAKHIDNEGKIIGCEYISESAIAMSSSKVIPANNIILVSRVSVGKIAFNNESIAINQDLTGICPRNHTISSKFLFYLLKQNMDYFVQRAQGLGVKGITRDCVNNYSIPLPPLEEQKAIVAKIEQEEQYVDACKKLIEINQQKITNKINSIWNSNIEDIKNE